MGIVNGDDGDDCDDGGERFDMGVNKTDYARPPNVITVTILYT